MMANKALVLAGLVVLAFGCDKKSSESEQKAVDSKLLLVRAADGEYALLKVTQMWTCKNGSCSYGRNPCICPNCIMCEPPDPSEVLRIMGTSAADLKKTYGTDKLMVIDSALGRALPSGSATAPSGSGAP